MPAIKLNRLLTPLLIAVLSAPSLLGCGPTPTPESTARLSTLQPLDRLPSTTPFDLAQDKLGTGGTAQAQGKAPTPRSSPTGPLATPTPTSQLDAISHLDPAGAQITLWHAFTKVEEQTLLALISEFNSQNEWGITVKPEYGGHYYDLHRKTLAAIAFGSPPEMTFTYHSRVAEYAQADVIQPLDDYIASEKYGLTEEELPDYFPAFLAGDRYPAFDGEQLSLSPSLGMEVMYYNVDMLNELGYENPPATWDEFKAMCMDATQDIDGDGINDTFGYAVLPSGFTFAGWVWGRGGELLSKDGQSVMFQEQGLEALALLEDLMDSGYAYQAVVEDGDRLDFGQGKVLFIFDSLDGLRYYSAAIEEGTIVEPEFEWSIAPFPHEAAKPVVGMYGPTLCVFKTTPQKQLAGWLFIKWFTESEQAARWAMAADHFPVQKSAVEAETMKAYFEENPLYEEAFGFLEYARMEPAIAGWQVIRDALYRAVVGVASGQMSSGEAIYQAVEEAEGVLLE
ncbi:MAG: extracellular solute-binding protein [Anaerolineae bacterium]|nr:extracellular solute-binding protein [Anaerolineae bacterium]